MKQTRVNTANLSPMEMNNMSSMMSMMNSIQKIGKGKRKYSLKLDNGEKKFLSKFIAELKKQFASSGTNAQSKNLEEFFSYVEDYTSAKKKEELKLSYEEYEFLKKLLVDSVKGMEQMQIKWYNIIKKLMVKMVLKQYKHILLKFK